VPKVYDCFAYYDEDMLLALRLQMLSLHVDYFVIVESPYTFTGRPKPLNFSYDNFKQFRDKIRYIVHHPTQLYECAWANETDNKNAVLKGLFDAQPQDLIMFSDIDEIPNPEAIYQYNSRYLYACFSQLMFNYQFNYLVCDPSGLPRPWEFAKITTYRHLTTFFKTPQNLRTYQKKRTFFGYIENGYRKLRRQVIPNGGWHFSWVMSAERIQEKMASLSHTDMNTDEFNNLAHIHSAIATGTDIWKRARQLIVVPLTTQYLPAYLLEHIVDYQAYLIMPAPHPTKPLSAVIEPRHR
jgi:beta-1,4-mannosyl-glycoprotein beta-1,4-N-acetylglucosaminyltransferase